ncbi:MAG: 50S ribosomal protein L1 [Spirochaetes bacterium GWD1_27_9]|nr:MAG: 50S ribosomal protein L1 [Spirochaetes bacterium GWB1_27_13]OHD21011.1 MAG: 50S ribosomal protein L1 [Spirochaetes bacterium GWC1_27_15]OHD45373.1 MAG: 50S ribosomal protein L1 [Spirochaetes bacterium GWD1_27_9]
MKNGSKKYNEALTKYSKDDTYDLEKGIDVLKNIASAKFDETVEVSLRLKLKKSHTVRDTVVLPNSFGKEKKILVFAKADKVKESLEAGAAYAGDDEYIQKIKDGWIDFDVVIATPDMMKDVGKLGPVLGRRGLMPNPKTGTVTTDIKGTIAELRKGRVEFRADKTGIVHLGVGKVSMKKEQIKDNIKTLYEEVLRKKPNDLKGDYVGSFYISTTMSPGVKINFKAI